MKRLKNILKVLFACVCIGAVTAGVSACNESESIFETNSVSISDSCVGNAGKSNDI